MAVYPCNQELGAAHRAQLQQRTGHHQSNTQRTIEALSSSEANYSTQLSHADHSATAFVATAGASELG